MILLYSSSPQLVEALGEALVCCWLVFSFLCLKMPDMSNVDSIQGREEREKEDKIYFHPKQDLFCSAAAAAA